MYMASDGVTIMNEIESAIFNAASDKTNAFIVSKVGSVQVQSTSSSVDQIVKDSHVRSKSAGFNQDFWREPWI
jgi:hypothetical protein